MGPSHENSYGYEEFMGPSETRTMFLEPATLIEVHNLINDLKNKTTLETKISVLKAANSSKNFVAAFIKVIDNSFEQGIFPDSLNIYIPFNPLLVVNSGG